jgi:hypothetical protein
MEERQKFGAALIGDSIHREVMQTTVSFMKHQLYSPGVEEAEARRALKCCIFNSVLASIRERLAESRVNHMERRKQLSILRSQLRKATTEGAAEKHRSDLEAQIETLEQALMQAARRPPTLEDHLAFVSDVLHNPERFISASFRHLHLTHMGIKVDPLSKQPSYELDIAEIRIATREPRVAALVRFPRCELLPKVQISLETDAFFPV